MEGTVKIVNELLVSLFNEILTIEKAALQASPFKDLSLTEIHVIEAIGLGSRTMTDIADKVGVTVGTLTTSMNRLVKKEYVTRNRLEDDRRFVQVELTHKGKLAYRMHEAFHAQMVKYMNDGLSNEDNEILIASLTRLGDFFKEKYHLTKNMQKE